MAADGASPNPHRRPRVMMVGDTVGGVWQYSLELCRALIARGYDVVLATMGRWPTDDQARDAAAIRDLAYFPSAYKLLWMDEPWTHVNAAARWLLDMACAVRPDVIQLNDFGHGDLPWPAPVVTVGHSCVLSWWRAVHSQEAPPAWTRYREHVTAALRAADAVVAPSHTMLHALYREYGALRNTSVIPNGRHDTSAESPSKLQCVFTAARVEDEGKNVAAVVSIAPRLAWPVCIAGGEKPDDVSNERSNNTYRLGRLDSVRIRRWFANASIYALPARYEPFGLSVLEAAQAGCALVLGDIDSLRENWDGAAAFVQPDDRDALAHTLRRLIADGTARHALACRARARAKRFTATAMADAYCRVYDTIGTRQRNGRSRHGDVS